MAKARDSGLPTMTSPVDLVQGGKGLLVFFPLYVRGESSGFILAVFRTQEWLDYVFGPADSRAPAADFKAAAYIDGQAVYEESGWAALAKNEYGISSKASILDHVVDVRVRPTEAFEASNESPMPWLALAFGGIVSLLIALGLRLYQRSSLETSRAQTAGRALKSEMEERKKLYDELQSTLLRIEWATRSARMGVWTWDLATGRLTWNERMFELYDIPPDVAPTYSTWRNAVHPEDQDTAAELLRRAVAGKATFDTEFRCLLSDGSIRYIKAAARVERDAEGKPRSMSGLNWDVSEAKRAETALKESEERVRLLLDSTGEAIYGIDLNGDCSFANPACARLLGYAGAEALLGKNMHRLIHHSYAGGAPMPVEECRIYKAYREGKPMHVEDEVLWRADGSSFPAEYWSYPQIARGSISGAVVTFVDITQRRQAEETIKHMATHDSLTDLPRMPLCRDRLEMAINAARRNEAMVGVIFLDLDGFKGVNDGYGHEAGDEVLREVARRMRSVLRDTDTVARIGGDEFLLIAAELRSVDNAAEIARKLIARIGEPIALQELRLRVGASLGIALYPGDADTVDELVRLSDQAMYEAKRGGKSGFRFASH
jgi:diguanylate cyclase (GGDEF)-like protein/PAS domain S-box-containing protein